MLRRRTCARRKCTRRNVTKPFQDHGWVYILTQGSPGFDGARSALKALGPLEDSKRLLDVNWPWGQVIYILFGSNSRGSVERATLR